MLGCLLQDHLWVVPFLLFGLVWFVVLFWWVIDGIRLVVGTAVGVGIRRKLDVLGGI